MSGKGHVVRFAHHIALLLMVASTALVGLSVVPVSAAARIEAPSIRITKKVCENTSFPVFVESHCYQDDTASFDIESPSLQPATRLRSGNQFKPSPNQFAQGDMWRIIDANESNYAPATVLSCLQYRPGENLMLGVAPVGNLRGLQRWDVWWRSADSGNGLYGPSLECIWFELPNLAEIPAVLSLQVFTSVSPYMYLTDADRVGLGEFPRGESGESLEANVAMSNQTTGDVYSFAADAYGQVLVPAGQYVVENTDSGIQGVVSMRSGATVLTEIGLAGFSSQGQLPIDPPASNGADFGQWGVVVQYCDGLGCSPVVGATVFYESLNGSTSGSCVTQATMGPAGPTGLCAFEFQWGVPVRLTLDMSTVPVGMVLVSQNPADFLVEENLGGDPFVPVFQLGPP